jgi:hypothetical protein
MQALAELEPGGRVPLGVGFKQADGLIKCAAQSPRNPAIRSAAAACAWRHRWCWGASGKVISRRTASSCLWPWGVSPQTLLPLRLDRSIRPAASSSASLGRSCRVVPPWCGNGGLIWPHRSQVWESEVFLDGAEHHGGVLTAVVAGSSLDRGQQ